MNCSSLKSEGHLPASLPFPTRLSPEANRGNRSAPQRTLHLPAVPLCGTFKGTFSPTPPSVRPSVRLEPRLKTTRLLWSECFRDRPARRLPLTPTQPPRLRSPPAAARHPEKDKFGQAVETGVSRFRLATGVHPNGGAAT